MKELLTAVLASRMAQESQGHNGGDGQPPGCPIDQPTGRRMEEARPTQGETARSVKDDTTR